MNFDLATTALESALKRPAVSRMRDLAPSKRVGLNAQSLAQPASPAGDEQSGARVAAVSLDGGARYLSAEDIAFFTRRARRMRSQYMADCLTRVGRAAARWLARLDA